MRKWFATVALVAIALVPLRADLTFVQTMTMEGPAAAMAGGAPMPKMTMRIKGNKARADIEVMGQTITSITDLDAKQVVLLNSADKTAQVMSAAAGAAIPMPKIDASFKATGKTQTIDGVACEEHTFALTMDMAEVSGGAQMPPEAAAMMKDVRMVMNGSMWLARNAPGAAEYTAFTKAAMDSNLFTAMTGMKPGQSGGLDKLMAAAASAPGLPYLNEITMVFEGTGPMVEAMKQMGPMKMVQKISSVSVDPLAEDLFRIPDGYTVQKK